MIYNKNMSIAAVIPAHMNSLRFPKFFPFFGYPMIEHVRRRITVLQNWQRVCCNLRPKIADVVTAHGGEVILTSRHHHNGTSRVAEAVEGIEASHIILLQGDEPLLLPSYVDTMVDAIARANGRCMERNWPS